MNLALALAAAALLALAQPNPNLTWLAFVALAPLIVAVARERRGWRRQFALGWAAGIVYWFAVCYWIQFVLEYHGGMGRWGGWGTFLLFCFLKGLHMAVFALAVGAVVERWYAVPAIALLWTGIERTHGTFGFAWLTLGNAAADMPLLPRLAPFIGVYGMSFAFALTAAALAVAMLRRPRHALPWLAAAAVLPLFPALPESKPTDIAAVVQPNFAEERDWTAPEIHSAERELADRSLALALQTPRASLIAWPETPGPIYFYNDAAFRDTAVTLARTAQAHFLFGTVAYAPENAPLNSAVLLSPAGEAIDRYDKMYLVPFGEFVPPIFGWVNRITKEAGDFTPGTRVVVSRFGSHALGTFICYESAFPHLVRQFALQGADVLANISNDGYFGHSAAREQHLKLVRMRAIENRRWIVRSTNDGITASVDPAGRIATRLPMYVETGGRLPFGYEPATTFYTLHGDWFAWSCLAIGVGASLTAPLAARLRGRSQRSSNRA